MILKFLRAALIFYYISFFFLSDYFWKNIFDLCPAS